MYTISAIIIAIIIFGVGLLAGAAPDKTEWVTMLDKGVAYLGTLGIPLVLFYFSKKQQDDQRKLEEEKDKNIQLEKKMQEQIIHKRYVEQARELREYIMRLLIAINGYMHETINKFSSNPYVNNNDIDSFISFFQFIRTLENHLKEHVNEEKKRMQIYYIFVKMQYLSEITPSYVWNLNGLRKIYPDISIESNVLFFQQALEKIIGKFSSHNDSAINEIVTILKEFDDEYRK